MRTLMPGLGAAALLGSAAFAHEVIVAPAPGSVNEHRAAEEDATTARTVTHVADGGARSNQDTGSRVTRSQSEC